MEDIQLENTAPAVTEDATPENSAVRVGSTHEMVTRYNHCDDCGSNLHFRHTTDFSRNLTNETAQCPECGAKPRSILHRLQ